MVSIFSYAFPCESYIFEEANKDENLLDDSYALESVLEYIQTKITEIFPDHHPLRVTNLMLLEISKVFGNNLFTTLTEFHSKNETKFENFLNYAEENNSLGFSSHDDEDFGTNNQIEIDYTILSKLKQVTPLKSDDIEKAVDLFTKLDLNELIYKSSLSFSHTKQMKSMDSDYCSSEEEIDKTPASKNKILKSPQKRPSGSNDFSE